MVNRINNNIRLSFLQIDVKGHTLEQVATIMQTTQRLIIKTRSAHGLPMNSSPLLRSFTVQKKSYGGMENQQNHPSFFKMLSDGEGKENSHTGTIISDR